MTKEHSKTLIQRFVRRLTCVLGLHKWQSDSDYFIGVNSCHEVCLFWWTCQSCGKSKLRHITR